MADSGWQGADGGQQLSDNNHQPSAIGHQPSAISHLQSAISLYRGDFLEDFYDDWVIEERYRLEAMFLEALARLIAGHQARGEFELALAYAQQLLRHDPLREDVHAQVMQLYCELGDRQAALRQYQRCREVLHQELNVEPLLETTALYEAIRDGRLEVRQPARVLPVPEPVTPQRGRSPFDVGAGLAPGLVGREAEIAELTAAWQWAAAGRGSLVLIEGEAGVGKTRLVQALAQTVRWQSGQVLLGQCYAFERMLPYQPLAEALRPILPLLDKLDMALRAKPQGEALPPWWLSEVARLFLSPHPPTPSPLSRAPSPKVEGGPGWGRERGEGDQQRLFEAVTTLLGQLASSGPVLLVLEDLHWATASTLQFLHFLAPRLAHNRLLVLATFRPEEIEGDHPLNALLHGLERQELAQRLTLSRLSLRAVKTLIGEMSGLGERAALLGERLYRHTEGNPFFLMETLKALFEVGQLRLVGTTWVSDFGSLTERLVSLPLPPSVHVAITSRLTHLSEEAREALMVAAVAGREFDLQVLWMTWGEGLEGTLVALDELLQRQLIREGEGLTGRNYEFGHHLIQEVVYKQLPRRWRQQVHGQIAQVLEAQWTERLDEIAAELAHHYDAAGDWQRALTCLRRAGDQARRSYAHQEALDYYGRGLVMLSSQRASAEASAVSDQQASAEASAEASVWMLQFEFDLLGAREEVQHLLGRRQAQAVDLTAMAEVAETLGDPLRRAQVLDRQAAFALAMDRYAEAEQAAQAALALHRAQGDRQGESISLVALGRACRAAGDYPGALDHWRQALAIQQEVDDQAGQGETLSFMGGLYYLQSDYPQALAHWKRALAIQQQIGERPGEALSLTHMGLAYEMLGDYAQALKHQEQALAIQRQIGYRHGEALALANMASHFCLVGDYAQALHHARQARALFEALGQRRGLAATLDTLGNACAALGDYSQALAHLERGLALFREIGERWGEGAALSSLGRAHLLRGEPQVALGYLTQAEELHRALGQAADATLDRSYQALAHLGLGQLDEARRCSEEALTTLEACPEDLDRLKQVCWHRYQVLRACEPEAAAEYLRRAHEALLAQAGRISDEGLRANFLVRVRVNQEIVQEMSQLG